MADKTPVQAIALRHQPTVSHRYTFEDLVRLKRVTLPPSAVLEVARSLGIGAPIVPAEPSWRDQMVRTQTALPEVERMHRTANPFGHSSVTATPFCATRKHLLRLTNILTQANYDDLLPEVWVCDLEGTCHRPEDLADIVRLIYSKALSDAPFAALYGRLCAHIYRHEWATTGNDNFGGRFRRELLNQCQDEFGRGLSLQAALAAVSPEEREDERDRIRRRAFANIRFVCVLYQVRVITQRILEQIVLSLVAPPSPTEEGVEMFCEIMATIGQQLHDDSPVFVKDCFAAAASIASKMHTRVMAKVQRESGRCESWKAASATKVAGLVTSANTEMARQRVAVMPIKTVEPPKAVVQSWKCKPKAEAAATEPAARPVPPLPEDIISFLQADITLSEIAKQLRSFSSVDLNRIVSKTLERLCVGVGHDSARARAGPVLSSLLRSGAMSARALQDIATALVGSWRDTGMSEDVPLLWSRWVDVCEGVDDAAVQGHMRRVPKGVDYDAALRQREHVHPP